MGSKGNIGRLGKTQLHDWYRHVYAYSDKLVEELVDEWAVGDDDLLLDPFNGTGTTTVAAKHLGIDCVGTDINPVGTLASRAKTAWDIDVDEFERRKRALLEEVKQPMATISTQGKTTLSSFAEAESEADLSEYDFTRSDKTPTGWMSERPHKKMCVLRRHVDAQPADEIGEVFRLAMVAILPESVANVGFGPEAYRTEPADDVDVFRTYARKLDKMQQDLRLIDEAVADGLRVGATEVVRADAREVGDVLRRESSLVECHGGVDYVITSPPYPAEHDYTRNQRLELVWMGEVWNNDDLRELKRNSIRSHTKNVYVDDDAGDRHDVRSNDRIDEIVSELEQKLDERKDPSGFEQTYPRVVEEYFGGMIEHLSSVDAVMNDGGKAGYVVADQQSYWNVPIETGTILGELAEERTQFEVDSVSLWRNLRPTTGEADELAEEILVLEK